MMRLDCSILIKFLALQLLALFCSSQDFDFFYFVQQWPGSYCDSKQCCYPNTGKPASDFGIHGLWPNYNDGTYPSNCDPQSPFDPSKISDLTSRIQQEWPSLACPSSDNVDFWSHEWSKHGTCSEANLDQHDYFATALKLKEQLTLLGALEKAGITPNGEAYALSKSKTQLKKARVILHLSSATMTTLEIANFIKCTCALAPQGRTSLIVPSFPMENVAPISSFLRFE